MYYLFCGVDEDESSAVIEVKLGELKLWLVFFTWLFLWELSTPKVMLLQLHPSLDTSFAQREIIEREFQWRPSDKLSNSIRETGEENRETIENILAS